MTLRLKCPLQQQRGIAMDSQVSPVSEATPSLGRVVGAFFSRIERAYLLRTHISRSTRNLLSWFDVTTVDLARSHEQ